MNLEKILATIGVERLNPMQQEAREAILRSRNDVVVLSPTGTGKTLAYLLPLTELIVADSDEVQALIVVPGRELALQSDNVLKNMGSGLRSQSCYGGRTAMEEHRVLMRNKPQIVFGTPGRLNDHLAKGNIRAEDIRYLIIDEFDKCLEMGFQGEMSQLMDRLPALKRRFLLSATTAEQIPNFVEMQRTTTLDYLSDEKTVSERVTVFRLDSPEKDKLSLLSKLLIDLGDKQSIVFLNYRDSVERTNDYLKQQGFVTSAFHGGLEQRQREDALYRFANGSANVLVSTDLASRGLDIPNIDNIIHYHLPGNEEAMVHRVGRTARWDALGQTFFLIGPEERMPEFVNVSVNSYQPDIEGKTMPKPRMATLYVGKGKKDKISKGDIVGFLCKKGGLSLDDIGRIDVKDRYTYVAVNRGKAQQVFRMVNGEKIKGLKTVVEPVR